MKVLIDTSSWTQALRESGDAAIRTRVEGLIASGRAAWCDPVRLELWNGARDAHDRNILLRLESELECPAITPKVWERAFNIAWSTRRAGVSVRSMDLIVYACALENGLSVEHNDKHFAMLERHFEAHRKATRHNGSH